MEQSPSGPATFKVFLKLKAFSSNMPLSELALTWEDLSLNKFYIHRPFFIVVLFSDLNSTTDPVSTKFKLGFALIICGPFIIW